MSVSSPFSPFSPFSGQRRLLEWGASAIIAGIALTLVIRTTWLMGRGFDFTDESFYLMWAQRPADFDIAYGLFGYGLHPLFELVGGSVSGLRRIAAIIVAVAGILTCTISLANTRIDRRGPVALQVISTSAILPFMYYILWLLTPSYNWFALLSALLLISAIVDLCQIRHHLRSSVFAAAAIVLMIFARPQNAMAFGSIYVVGIVLVVPLFPGKLKQMALLVFWSAAILLIFAYFAPIRSIVKQIEAYLVIFGMHHPLEIGFWDRMFEFIRDPGRLLACSTVLFLISITTQQRLAWSRWRIKLLLVITALVLSAQAIRDLRSAEFVYRIGPTMGALTYIVLSLGCVRKDANFRLLSLLGLAALLPLAATFGSADRIFEQLDFFCGVWGIIALVAVADASSQQSFRVATAAAVCLAFVYAAIQSGLSHPYRLAAPVEMQSKSTMLGWGSELKLDAKTSKFIETLRQHANEAGFCRGDPTIDLGSARPGIVFAIGGRAPVFPWIISGYQFSERFGGEVLKRVDETLLMRTWLITGESSFSTDQLKSFGIDLTAHKLVVELRDPLNDGVVKLFAPRAISGSCS
jgi:hypothetical protein